MASYSDYLRNIGMSDPADLTSALSNWGGVSKLIPPPSVSTNAVPAPVATPTTNYFGDPNYNGEGFTGVGGGGGLNVVPTQGGGSMWDSFKNWMKDSGVLGSTDIKTGIKTDGWGGLALGAAQGLGNAFMGMQQYNLAKDTFNENKRQFNLNFEAQRKTTNAALEDRQRARVASNSSAYQSVGDYMNKYGV